MEGTRVGMRTRLELFRPHPYSFESIFLSILRCEIEPGAKATTCQPRPEQDETKIAKVSKVFHQRTCRRKYFNNFVLNFGFPWHSSCKWNYRLHSITSGRRRMETSVTFNPYQTFGRQEICSKRRVWKCVAERKGRRHIFWGLVVDFLTGLGNEERLNLRE